MHRLKLTQIGNSVGVVWPKEALARLKPGKGDKVFLTETPPSNKMAGGPVLFSLRFQNR